MEAEIVESGYRAKRFRDESLLTKVSPTENRAATSLIVVCSHS